MFEIGTLRDKVAQATARALRNGGLQPIATNFEFIEDAGVHFLVRTIAHLARKQQGFPPGGGSGRRFNPFLPYDAALYVADASESHVCLLNKYNVVDNHLLIVTREFERQEAPLNLADFTALWTCMAEYNSLGFYNAGRVAGASQPHKHLQLVPLPLAPRGPEVPLAPLIESAGHRGEIGRCGSLPFRHAAAKLDPSLTISPDEAARKTVGLYRSMMLAVGLNPDSTEDGESFSPYNLLVTRRWMLLIPRSRESFAAISVNALGFAGALLVRHDQEMNSLKKHGPMAALQYVTLPQQT